MKIIDTLVILPALLAAMTCSARDRDSATSDQVQVANGTVSGVAETGGVRVFKGIPYAQPPVGELRWREPQPVKDWTGVRAANQFGSRAVQPTLWSDMIFRSGQMDEDCLYLNVWTAAGSAGDKLPVFVYFHGGGLVAGDGSEARYDGASMARQGVVVVTINYRLGVFGFFAHPELTKESPHHASGNYGFMDQNAALRWVQKNIAAFGGDPTRVTIGGQSAGSSSVCAQMASPLSRGLFAGAIGQSGSALGSRDVTLAEGEEAGLKFATSAGADSLAALRGLSADALLKASAKNQYARGVIVDGYFMPESPQAIYAAGRQARVPLLAGWTSAEVGYQSIFGKDQPTAENYIKAVRSLYGTRADEVLKVYPAPTDADVAQAASDLVGDRFAGYRTWKWIGLHRKTAEQSVYRYLFAQLLPEEKTTDGAVKVAAQHHALGAPHSSDIPYAMGNLDLVGAYAWTAADVKTSGMMQRFFLNFIKTGNPNDGSEPRWPTVQPGEMKVMVIRENSSALPESNPQRFTLLDSIQP